jgi:hypothetical protein
MVGGVVDDEVAIGAQRLADGRLARSWPRTSRLRAMTATTSKMEW